MINNLFDHLHPDHLADLWKSGLPDETILDAGIRSLRPADIKKIKKALFEVGPK